MSTANDITLVNQFGEVSVNKVKSIGQTMADAQPAKTGVQAVVAIATADLVAEATANLVAIATIDAIDLASAIALVNELKAAYNLNVALVNSIKAKYNLDVILTNAEKAKVNEFLAASKVIS